MEFDDDTLKHLRGELFSNGYPVRVSDRKSETPSDRLGWLESRVRGKRVIHLGCVDHLPLIEKKIESDEWLHARLLRAAKRCIGVDINEEGVRYLKERLGVPDIVCADILSEDIDAILADRWDALVIAEVLEHIDDPVGFLSTIRHRYSTRIDEAIVTVPNALRLNSIRDTLKGRETINTDHRYWFTPYTLAKILTRAGLRPDFFGFVDGRPRSGSHIGSLPRRLLLRRFPALRDTLVMQARFTDSSP